MKYVIFRNNNIPSKPQHAVIFARDGLTHKQVAGIHRASEFALTSAGFFDMTEDGPVTLAATSETLNNEFPPRPEDAAIILEAFQDFGVNTLTIPHQLQPSGDKND